MGVLAALLSQPTAPEPAPARETITVDQSGNYSKSFYTDPHDDFYMPANRKELHNVLDVPDGYAITGDVTYRNRELVNGGSVTAFTYKFREVPKPLDIDDLAERVAKAPPANPIHGAGPHWFVFQAGDLQLGKIARDGSTEQIVETYMQSVRAAVVEYESLSDEFGVSGVQLSFPGDCMEGVVSQGGRNIWLTQETITEQTRIFRRLLLWTVDQFAPIANHVYVDVVNGNHDEANRQVNTKPGDGWATECAIALSDAMELNPEAYGHVEVRVPDSWCGHMTVPVGDSLVTVAHGHQWRRGKGMGWWAEQALNLQSPTTSGVLQHGHIHTYEIETTRDRTRISSPTFDTGSDWFREIHGGDSKLGGLVYLLRSNEISRVSLV
ncbi:MRE11 double-strand break endo/exonuclease [Gordonia phage Kudefre]|uniref:MRE11 double-strand break endo/exonuclease n=1 Tax=Gordonia phage Kudefre TaxID=2885975 RepID=A0AAE8Y917_9CAUD|nr:exonuclease [Gordonia phage Kudefre]UDL15334.1 MRE11 double-strand break endo/exonuclease [Gordonia phage Kudefre]